MILYPFYVVFLLEMICISTDFIIVELVDNLDNLEFVKGNVCDHQEDGNYFYAIFSTQLGSVSPLPSRP